MRKLFTFTGAQSTGKTTLLKKVKTLYPYRFDYVDEVTRRIKRFGVPINNEAKNYNLTQSLIINDHLVNYTKVFEGSDDTVRDLLLDRCIVDGYIYTKYFYKQGKVSSKVFNFAEYWFKELTPKYDVIFYTNPADVKLIDDGVRSTKAEFRQDIIDLYETEFLDKYDNICILKGSVEERLEIMKIGMLYSACNNCNIMVALDASKPIRKQNNYSESTGQLCGGCYNNQN
jgi:nicotinamide riboside kinase